MRFHLTCFRIVLLVAPLLAGCTTSPPPKVILDNALTRIEIRTEVRANHPHTHPAPIQPERLRMLLSGVRIQVLSDRFRGVSTAWSDPIPLFTSTDLSAIVDPLAEALGRAGPNELVTFYLRVSDAAVGLAYTTGGVFVQDELVYVIVANYRSLPSDTMLINTVPGTMTDPVNQPLLTMGTKYYRLSHQQSEAEVHLPENDSHGPWIQRYDEGKTLVVNLSLLRQESRSLPPHMKSEERHAR